MICTILLAAATAVPVVRAGRPSVCMVVPQGAPPAVSNAANAFVEWTFAKTGVHLPVVADAPASSLPPFSFRTVSKGDGFSGDGFRIDASRKGIVVQAVEPEAFAFAVHYMLNRFAGIDWFHPESGADFERADGFSVPAGAIVRTPPSRRCGHTPGNPQGEKSERAAKKRLVVDWNVRNGFPSKRNRMGGHVIGDWLLWAPVDETALKREIEAVRKDWTGIFKKQPHWGAAETYARWKLLSAEHPDWFAKIDGKPIACGQELIGNGRYNYLGSSAMPCLSNPEVRRQMLANFKKRRRSLWFAEMDRVDFDVICDDQPFWCECERCAKMMDPDVKDGKASNYYWDFINWIAPRIADDDPTVTINAYAYQSHRAFPNRVKPLPLGNRLNVVVCTHGRCFLHPLTDSKCKWNAPVRKMIEDWSAAGFPVLTLEYMCQTPGMCNYFSWERSWVADLKWYHKMGVAYDGLVGPWFGYFKTPYFDQNGARARWHLAYLTGRFTWDPDDDFDAVRDAAFAKYYRSAGRTMSKYRKYLEQKTMDAGICMGYTDTEHGAHDMFAQGVAGRPGVLEPARRMLAEAKKAAAGDKVALERIADDERYFEKEWGEAAPLAEGEERFSSMRRLDDLLHGKYYITVGNIKDYPENARALRVSFRAKGRAEVRFEFKRGRDAAEPIPLKVDSPNAFEEHSFEVPARVHPRTFLMFTTDWLTIEEVSIHAVM